MSPTLVSVLTLTSGMCWTLVYIDIILRGFKDKTYGMPLFALAFNIAWEFIFGFVKPGDLSLQKAVNVIWFCFDAVILVTYFKYGRKEFPKSLEKYFIPWSLLAFSVGLAVIYFADLEFEGYWGAAYSAFTQNLMMSVLFIAMLVRRGNVDGQSMYIAIFKWLGTLAPTIQGYATSGSKLILALGIGLGGVGVFGALLAIYLRGLPNDVYFQIGFLTTLGLSTKNAILIVQFIKEQRRQGEGLIDATLAAVRIRFRPVIMTSLAFFFGTLPLALTRGAGAAAQNAIGTAVTGGLLSATFIDLLFIPFFFVLVSRLFARKRSPQPALQPEVALAAKEVD